MRKKWDPRLDSGHAIERYTQSSFQVYSVMKSPSYFIWARDIVCMQETAYAADGSSAEMLQVSVEDEERLPEKGSYAKSRTRATVELSAWSLEKEGENTKLSYIVKVHLNGELARQATCCLLHRSRSLSLSPPGSIPTSVVQMLAVETPMCVGRVRDVFYQTGYVPYELVANNTSGEYADHQSVSVLQLFDDGDGTEATSGERRWTAQYLGTGKDTVHIAYDGQRMYPAGVHVEVQGDAAAAVTVNVDEQKKLITLEVAEEAKDKNFDVVVTPK